MLKQYLVLGLFIVGALWGGQLGATAAPKAPHPAHSTAASTPATAADAGYDLKEGQVFYVELLELGAWRGRGTCYGINPQAAILPNLPSYSPTQSTQSSVYICLDQSIGWALWDATLRPVRGAFNFGKNVARIGREIGSTVLDDVGTVFTSYKDSDLQKSLQQYKNGHYAFDSVFQASSPQDWIRVTAHTINNKIYARFCVGDRTLNSLRGYDQKKGEYADYVGRYQCAMLNLNQFRKDYPLVRVIPIQPLREASSTKSPEVLVPCLVYLGIANHGPLGGNAAGEYKSDGFLGGLI